MRQFYAAWFTIDDAVREKFPPDLTHQRQAFGHALRWVLGELVAQRAQEPVAFLAQLGRDHRKYGVSPRHYDTMRRACTARCALNWLTGGTTRSTTPPSAWSP